MKRCGKGFSMNFCGAFSSKTRAEAAEKKHPGAFIKFQVMRRHGARYLVLVPKRKKKK